jgi:hypothetical protein
VGGGVAVEEDGCLFGVVMGNVLAVAQVLAHRHTRRPGSSMGS